MNIKCLCAALLLLPIMVAAGVNPKNGNFFISYEEITQKSGNHELSLPRTYNSKAVDLGWFGYGWGTRYETRMVVMPDGTVAVKENGSGEIIYYGRASSDKVQASVDKIVAVASEREKLEPNDAIALRGKLLADEYLRLTNVTRHRIQSELPTGATAQARDCRGSAVTRLNDEYGRTNCNQSNDYFDLAGHLIRHESYGYKFTVHYSDKYPDRVEDSLGQKLFFKWTDDGHIAEARTGEPKPVVRFIYNKKHDLVLSDIIEGIFYKYEYDANHNMTRIVYYDNTHMDMQYDENGSITSVTEWDGAKATYSYRTDPKNPLHYWTTTTVTSVSGRQASREQEFLTTADAAGTEQVATVSTIQGQARQDVVMDERGRMKRVTKPDGSVTEYIYHPTHGKVIVVLTSDGGTHFHYNDAGDLIDAEDDQGHLITLAYDSNRRISSMVQANKPEHSRSELTFKYNAEGKPIQIKLTGGGEINVEYDDKGEVTKAESKEGVLMSLEVTKVLQSVLKVVKVAGVDLRM